MNKLIIGSRGSELALLQTKQVRDMLLAVYPLLDIHINIIQTQGDKNLDKPLYEIGGKSIFTTELEDALLNHHIDLAVHSLKDLPSTLEDGLIYTGSPEREDARDVFVSNRWETLAAVPSGGSIATGSIRRKAQLLHQRPDLHIIGLRGNIDTRLRKLDESKWDGIITAASAMHRLGLQDRISQYLDPEYFVPAGGQGALGLETIVDREDVKQMASAIIDKNTTQCCQAERQYLTQMEGDCFAPIGCWARMENDGLHITGYSSSLDGSRYLIKTVQGDIIEADKLALKLADKMIQHGARELMA